MERQIKEVANLKAPVALMRVALFSGMMLGACSDSPTKVDELFLGCDSVGSIQVGGRASGSLTPSDCRERAGAYVDFYELRLSATQGIDINLYSNSFDTYLVLLDRATAQVRAQNNDIDVFTSNSQIRDHYSPGTYVIVVTSYRVGEEGAYRLTVEPVP